MVVDMETAAQMAAWFLRKSPGSSMPHLKLIKLLYLAERISIKQNRYPILGDYLVSMPHGPVLSETLNYMKGCGPPDNKWNEWISPIKDHEVSLVKKYEPEDLDLLGNVTLGILEEVWSQFGHMDQWEIRDYTHHNCPEWKDPEGSSLPITYEQLLCALGYRQEEAMKNAPELEAQQQIREALIS